MSIYESGRAETGIWAGTGLWMGLGTLGEGFRKYKNIVYSFVCSFVEFKVQNPHN